MRFASGGGRTAWLVLAGALSLCGCSLLVSNDDPVRCTLGPDGADPCPGEEQCVNGACTRVAPGECTARAEQCNGLDDDCDELVDEGLDQIEERCNGEDDNCNGVVDEGHDVDEDGFTWCGGGIPDLRDCDDGDSGVFPAGVDGTPAGTEVCDGIDNDCDSTVDEGGDGLCTGSERCFDRLGCLVPNCTLPGEECGPTERCDVNANIPVCISGRCDPVTNPCDPGLTCDASGSCLDLLEDGEPCVTDGQCLSRTCFPLGSLGLTADTVEGLCTKACCTDGDCPQGTVCWTGSAGGRACIFPEILGLVSGAGAPGDACSTGGECASGICLGAAGCLGNCGHDAHCPGDLICGVQNHTFMDVPFTQPLCRTPVGTATFAQSCDSDDECASGICLGENLLFSGQCTQPCATTDDCPALNDYCAVLDIADRDYHPICLGTGFSVPPQARTGEACTSDDQCRDFGCVEGVCADTCCSDATCQAGTRCKPVRDGANWEMRCRP